MGSLFAWTKVNWLAEDKWNIVAQISRRQKLLGNKMILRINFGIHAWMGK